MSTQASAVSRFDSQFAADVRAGLTAPGQKWLPSTYLYDDIGSALFDAITLLPEYGLTRADARVIASAVRELPRILPQVSTVAELGSGSGKKTRAVLDCFDRRLDYYPIDVSSAALENCRAELSTSANVHPICAAYLTGLARVPRRGPMLVLFLGSTIGNFSLTDAESFLGNVRRHLHPGDGLLLGADLIKPVPVMIDAYDDPAGVTAAFNLNLLARINRELGGTFNLRTFHHEARWNAADSAIEMHAVSLQEQTIDAAGVTITLNAGETIWTESSRKYTTRQLDSIARKAGFKPARRWIDRDWPFAECLWLA